MNLDSTSLNWLQISESKLVCLKCNGNGCESCYGTGKASRIQSRTEAIRRYQESNNHIRCFGRFNKKNESTNLSPYNCGEEKCIYRQQCMGLYKPQYHIDRLREDSLEFLSRLFFSARAIEPRLPNFTPYQSTIADLIYQWFDDTPQVAVLGAFSSGKSHLLNKLIGKDILPVSRTPTTAVITLIKYDESTHAVLEYRNSIKITLLSKNAQSPDYAVISALRSWLNEPEKFGIKIINEIDDQEKSHKINYTDLLSDIEELSLTNDHSKLFNKTNFSKKQSFIRTIKRRKELNISQLIRTFEVIFDKPNNIVIPLNDKKNIENFGKYVTEPALALCFHRATCFFPDKRLLFFNMLDTAGLCSPIGFHKDITTELLQRHPDKILVLLDSRRLESPTNREALLVLKKFIKTQDDYRQVTFALTFWDNALRTHMMEDSDPAIDFSNETLRKEEGDKFSNKKRKELTKWLTLELGIPCNDEPTIFMLGLGAGAPSEMLQTLDLLWRHIESECSGWIGVEMWAARWSTAKSYSDELTSIHTDNIKLLNDIISDINNSNDIESEIDRIKNLKVQIQTAVKRSKSSLKDVIVHQKNKMLVEIENLSSKKLILKYLNEGYWNSANDALNVLQEESKKQKEALTEIYYGFKYLKIISLDRKLLGLEQSVKSKAEEEVSDFFYHLKSIWDFLFGSIIELNEDNRKAVRKILSNEVQDTFEILEQSANDWIKQTSRISEKAYSDLEVKKESISEQKSNRTSLLEKRQRKLDFLNRNKQKITDLTNQIVKFSERLRISQDRINSCRQKDFKALLYTVNGSLPFYKGHERDLLILNKLSNCQWNYLEITSNGKSKHYYPTWANNEENRIIFSENKSSELIQIIKPPIHSMLFKLYLSSLSGFFIIKKK